MQDHTNEPTTHVAETGDISGMVSEPPTIQPAPAQEEDRGNRLLSDSNLARLIEVAEKYTDPEKGKVKWGQAVAENPTLFHELTDEGRIPMKKLIDKYSFTKRVAAGLRPPQTKKKAGRGGVVDGVEWSTEDVKLVVKLARKYYDKTTKSVKWTQAKNDPITRDLLKRHHKFSDITSRWHYENNKHLYGIGPSKILKGKLGGKSAKPSTSKWNDPAFKRKKAMEYYRRKQKEKKERLAALENTVTEKLNEEVHVAEIVREPAVIVEQTSIHFCPACGFNLDPTLQADRITRTRKPR